MATAALEAIISELDLFRSRGRIMVCAIIESPEMMLEHALRMVALKIADKLSLEDCI
jgi:hypothetical protein